MTGYTFGKISNSSTMVGIEASLVCIFFSFDVFGDFLVIGLQDNIFHA
jgi:hypothetical protein